MYCTPQRVLGVGSRDHSAWLASLHAQEGDFSGQSCSPRRFPDADTNFLSLQLCMSLLAGVRNCHFDLCCFVPDCGFPHDECKPAASGTSLTHMLALTLRFRSVTAFQEDKALARTAQAGFVKKGEGCSMCCISPHLAHQTTNTLACRNVD